LLIRRYRSRLDFYQSAAGRPRRIWTRMVVNDDVIDTEGKENRPWRGPSGELDP
jgi:hypothetical protein